MRAATLLLVPGLTHGALIRGYTDAPFLVQQLFLALFRKLYAVRQSDGQIRKGRRHDETGRRNDMKEQQLSEGRPPSCSYEKGTCKTSRE